MAMLRSMTGFGKATGRVNGSTVTVEVSSVNHRFLDVNFRMPNEWAAVDPALRETLKSHLSRGKVYVNVSRKRVPASMRQPRANWPSWWGPTSRYR